MQVNSIAEYPREHSAILSTFIKLLFVYKTFVLSIFEWPFKTDFTVYFQLKTRARSRWGAIANPHSPQHPQVPSLGMTLGTE